MDSSKFVRWQQRRKRLWDHMACSHALHLLESEQDEIERIVLDDYKAERDRVVRALCLWLFALAALCLVGFGILFFTAR